MWTWFQKVLKHPLSVPGAILLGVLLRVGAVNNGFLLDDYLHQQMLTPNRALPFTAAHPLDLYRLIPGDAEFVGQAREMGINPWWGQIPYQATFFRPLSSLLLYVDHLLWPGNATLMHIHSLLWFVLMCVSAFLLFRRILPAPHLAALGLAFFALDDAATFPAGWIANRNSMIAATLAFVTLNLHMRWQGENWKAGAVLAPLSLGVALLAGEFALGVCGFLLAHTVFLESGTLRHKALRLLPYGMVVIAWRLGYNALGYGVWGSDLYVDPLHNPAGFVDVLLQRLPVLLASGFGSGGAEISTFIPPGMHWVLTGVSLAVVGLFALGLRPLVKTDATSKFLVTGTVLSLIPSCATFAHDRLLLIAAVGIFGVISRFVGTVLFRDEAERQVPGQRWASGTAARVLAVLWLVLHGVVSPLSVPLKTEIPDVLNRATLATTRSLPDDLSFRTVVIVAAPDLFASTFLPLWRGALGLSVPPRTVALYNGFDPLTVIRETGQSLILEVKDGMLGVWTDALVREKRHPFKVGQTIDRAATRFTVLAVTADGNPTRVRATFNTDLSADAISFWYWRPEGYVPFPLPARGDSTEIQLDLFSILKEPEVPGGG